MYILVFSKGDLITYKEAIAREKKYTNGDQEGGFIFFLKTEGFW